MGFASGEAFETSFTPQFLGHRTIGLGSTAKDMHITSDELQRFTVLGGLRLGANDLGSVEVNGISQLGSNTVSPDVNIVAANTAAVVTFKTGASVFNAINVQADKGVSVESDVTGDVGNIYLNGDLDETSNSLDTVEFSDTVSLVAETVLTLQGKSGNIIKGGLLTLKGGSGIIILENFTGAVKSKALVKNSSCINPYSITTRTKIMR